MSAGAISIAPFGIALVGHVAVVLRWAIHAMGGILVGAAPSWVFAADAVKAVPPTPAASAAFDFDNPPRIRLVRRSTEPFDVALPMLTDLPKTLSMDPLTPLEILEIQTTMFNRLKPAPDPVPSYADVFAPCMQWLFIRHGHDEPWLTVGTSIAAKINGKLRYVQPNYRIPARNGHSGGWELPGYVGSGSVLVSDWTAWNTYSELSDGYLDSLSAGDKKARTDGGRIGWVFNVFLLNTSRLAVDGRSGTPPSTLERLTWRSHLAVTGQNGTCTHMAGKCRRYVGNVDRESVYAYGRPSSGSGGKLVEGARGVIEVEANSYSDIAIEDYCPFTRGAMVQQRLNSRLSGGSNLKEYAIGDNPSLRNALKPFVEGGKK